jgi:cytochrome c-type biogenesis protein CcmH/NrfG
VSVRPDYPQAWRVLAEIRFKAGQVDGGIEALTRACQLDPSQQEWQTLLNAKQQAAPQTIEQSTK